VSDWRDVLADLESQLDAADQSDFAAEVADRVDREATSWGWLDRLRDGLGSPITVDVVGGGALRGRVQDTGPDWLLLTLSAGELPVTALLIRPEAVLGIRGAGPTGAPVAGAVAARWTFPLVLRRMAREDPVVQVWRTDGGRLAGQPLLVGRDYLELAVADGTRLLVPFSAIAAVGWR
jgi:hypothetical protein